MDGYPYVDESTNEIYTMTFTNENSLFQSRIGGRHQNFTWTTADSDLFAIQSNQDYTAQYNAGAIADANTYQSKSFEENRVTDSDFGTWINNNTLTNWSSSAENVISKHTLVGQSPSGSNDFAVKFETQGVQRLRLTSAGLVKILGDGQNDGFYLSNAYGQAGIFGGMYYNGSSWAAITTDTDVKVLVSSNDSTAGYLNGKLVAGTGISFTESNDGSNETLTITNTGEAPTALAIALG